MGSCTALERSLRSWRAPSGAPPLPGKCTVHADDALAAACDPFQASMAWRGLLLRKAWVCSVSLRIWLT